MSAFVGRTEPLARLTAAHRAVVQPPGAASADWTGLVLVTGEAGMGKTALLNQFARRVTDDGGSVAWGTCWDGDQAPAWWPWTQVL
ncbi:MAG TPA: ATP-binding protein, partial [Actinomycetes bacterium]|nr:ATP-binding protein [Actinomycetes bacterium]